MELKARPYSTPRFGGATIPHNRTEIFRAWKRRSMVSKALRVMAGSKPRNASLAPSSRMTASVPSGTDQSSRANPPAAVSPETPAFTTLTANPLAMSARCNCAGNASLAARPYPAVRESPSATILTGCSAARAWVVSITMHAPVAHSIMTAACHPPLFIRREDFPYDRGGLRAPHHAKPRSGNLMDDTSVGTSHLIPAISLAGVNLSLGQGAARVHILKDIFLTIDRGEAVGLVGPSGSGKSTLLMVMAGLERPDRGSVTVTGQEFGRLDEDALARFRGRQIGIVFQSFHLIPTMTALENVAVPLELAGFADATTRAAEELASVGLGDRLHHYPTQLSGGEQQRVALARALAPDPAILVADEPTGNLDEATGTQIIDLIFTKHAERGRTLVLVTHDTSLAQRCDRVVRLRSGRIESTSADHASTP